MLSLLALVFAASVTDAAAKRTGPVGPPLPKEIKLPKDLPLPRDLRVAIYVPRQNRELRFYAANGFGMDIGRSLEGGIESAGKNFFAETFFINDDAPQPYGLLVAIHPEFKGEGNMLSLKMTYDVFGDGSTPLLSGSQTATLPVTGFGAGGDTFGKLSLRAAQFVLADVATRLRPDAATFPARANFAQLDRKALVGRSEPVGSGTGFFVNDAGQVLTAAHVIEECVLVEVTRDGRTAPGRLVARSNLLDLAVLDTGWAGTNYLPFRKGAGLVLGEAVTNVGYPLQKVLASTPNVTRGNVSSRGAMEGSVGQFQFSAPIQPGSSGGPVVSDGGELLGVTVSTLNVAQLAQQGVLPQNVNFALEAAHALKFLRTNGVRTVEVEPNMKGDMRTANEAALAAVTIVRCYQ